MCANDVSFAGLLSFCDGEVSNDIAPEALD